MLSLAACGSSQSAEKTWEDELGTAGLLRVGIATDYPPYESYDADGNVVGLDADIAQLIADKLGVKLEIVPMSFDTCCIYSQPGTSPRSIALNASAISASAAPSGREDGRPDGRGGRTLPRTLRRRDLRPRARDVPRPGIPPARLPRALRDAGKRALLGKTAIGEIRYRPEDERQGLCRSGHRRPHRRRDRQALTPISARGN